MPSVARAGGRVLLIGRGRERLHLGGLGGCAGRFDARCGAWYAGYSAAGRRQVRVPPSGHRRALPRGARFGVAARYPEPHCAHKVSVRFACFRVDFNRALYSRARRPVVGLQCECNWSTFRRISLISCTESSLHLRRHFTDFSRKFGDSARNPDDCRQLPASGRRPPRAGRGTSGWMLRHATRGVAAGGRAGRYRGNAREWSPRSFSRLPRRYRGNRARRSREEGRCWCA